MRLRERLDKAAPTLGLGGAVAVCATVHLIIFTGGFAAAAAVAGRWWPVAAIVVALTAAAGFALVRLRQWAGRQARGPRG